MAKSLKTAYLIALVVLGIFFVFYFMKSSEGFYSDYSSNTNAPSAQKCFGYCNGDLSAGTYGSFDWCDGNYWVHNAAQTTNKCTSKGSCNCSEKRM